jgi:hypothetical protein
MQTLAYEGYFNEGRFYVSGKIVQIPERKRVVITLLDDIQNADSETAGKREALRNLRGSCKDPTMVEPSEIPPEYDLCRRFDLI